MNLLEIRFHWFRRYTLDIIFGQSSEIPATVSEKSKVAAECFWPSRPFSIQRAHFAARSQFIQTRLCITVSSVLEYLRWWVLSKVNIEKSCGEVSLMEQDTIENVSQPKKSFFLFLISYIFDTSKFAKKIFISFEVYDGFIGQKILKLWRQESWPFGPNLNSCSIKISHRGTSL